MAELVNREIGELKEKVRSLEKQLFDTKNSFEKMLDEKLQTVCEKLTSKIDNSNKENEYNRELHNNKLESKIESMSIKVQSLIDARTTWKDDLKWLIPLLVGIGLTIYGNWKH
jgi:hypothetical protein